MKLIKLDPLLVRTLPKFFQGGNLGICTYNFVFYFLKESSSLSQMSKVCVHTTESAHVCEKEVERDFWFLEDKWYFNSFCGRRNIG